MVLRIKIQKRIPGKGTSEQILPTVKCPECSKEITPDAQFCSHCKAVIVRKYCPRCKALIPDHLAICPYCEASHSQKSRWPSIPLQFTGIAAGVLLLIIAAILAWPQHETRQVQADPSSSKTSETIAKPLAGSQSPEERIEKAPQQTAEMKPPQQSVKIPGTQNVNNVEEGARLNLKGHALIRQGDYQKALPLLYKAVNSFPEGSNRIDYVFAQYNLAHSLRKVGKPEAAIPYLERCLAYDRDNQKFQLELEAARRDLNRKKDES